MFLMLKKKSKKTRGGFNFDNKYCTFNIVIMRCMKNISTVIVETKASDAEDPARCNKKRWR